MRDPSRVRVVGPLERYATGFVAELSGRGYTPLSAVFQMQLVAHASRWLEAEGLDAGDLTAGVVDRFMAARREAGYANHSSARALMPLLEYLRSLGAAPPEVIVRPVTPHDVLLERYAEYLRCERGLAAGSVVVYLRAVRPFLAGHEPDALEHLTRGDIAAFVTARCAAPARGGAKLTVTALRSLLGFLHVEGVISQSLVGAVPSVASWRLAGLPQTLEPEQVALLLRSCDRRARNGRRDFAILTVLARLGLRAGELAGLKLDDVDWAAGEIVVRGKGPRSERLPLPADVGEAIVAYLRHGRPPTTDRGLFVRVKAPHSALSGGGVTQVVAAASKRAGLGQIYAHRLRHTAASEMLRAGAPLSEIGQVLRHRTALTTAIYAKVDRQSLRQLARPWPGEPS